MFQNVKRSDIDSDLRIYAADFETTTGNISEDQTHVWSFAIDEVGEYKPEIYGSIDDFWSFCGDPARGVKKRVYFHNLKFDGEFILWSALHDYGFTTAIDESGSMRKAKFLIEKEIVYAISNTGNWYFISFMYKGCRVEVRDSLKLLPLTLEQVGGDICTKYKKTSMNYDDKASLADCSASDIEYIKNDVLVLSEALDKMLMLHDSETPFGSVQSLTIGGACWQRFKQTQYGTMKNIVIHLDKEELDFQKAGSNTMDEYIRHGYRGGYCYVNEKIEGKTINEPGFTADVNSLYPFAMCNEYSGFVYPYGKGMYVQGRVPDKYIDSNGYYFYARIAVSFQLREGYVPTIQQKKSFMFLPNLYLKSSRVYDSKEKKYVGDPMEIELTLAKDDYILFFEHYDILSFRPLDYIVFTTADSLCDQYIKELSEIKIQATKEGNRGIRQISKLFQNNLYGQFSKGDNSSFKVAEIDEETSATRYVYIEEHNKKVTNISIGAAVTAHARFYQINTIQANINRFCYSDTDSLHCIGDPSEFVGEIDATKYGAYDIESRWTRARFVRQKTYIEETSKGFTICCAGMTDTQKKYFCENHDFEDFKIGLHIPGGKLQPKRIPGGVILKEVDFTLN